MVIRGEITKDTLEQIYKTIQSIITDPNCYYSKEEIKKMKEDKNNTFINERG